MGLKDIYFSSGTANDAADFLVTKIALSRHVGIQSYRGANTVLRVLKKMIPPVSDKLVGSTRSKFEDGLGNQEKEMLVLDQLPTTCIGMRQKKIRSI